MKRGYVLLSILCISMASCATENHAQPFPDYCQYYPHWSDCLTNTSLASFETFLNKYKADAHNYVAAFDWDGTLFEEDITIRVNNKDYHRSFQSIWHLWGARQLLNHQTGEYDFLFPSFKEYDVDPVSQTFSANYTAWSNAIIHRDDYLEGAYKEASEPPGESFKTVTLPTGVYDKFGQIALFETGMTFHAFNKGVDELMIEYQATHYSFFKVMDSFVRLQSLGFNVWIITGSNPYFLVNVITGVNGVNDALKASGIQMMGSCQNYMDHYQTDPAIQTADQFFNACPIAGNGAVWGGGKSPFVRRYVDRNFDSMPAECNNAEVKCLMAINELGKVYAALHVKKVEQDKKMILFAGNSGGDYNIMKSVLDNNTEQEPTFGVFVQPRSSLNNLFEQACSGLNCIKIDHPE